MPSYQAVRHVEIAMEIVSFSPCSVPTGHPNDPKNDTVSENPNLQNSLTHGKGQDPS